uniref:Uncharacterized protein n=1 Tax=Desertifilum tharense IPPAS B-1220 TaxID=1781255 RepID=A0ACD5GPS7_9CYAN
MTSRNIPRIDSLAILLSSSHPLPEVNCPDFSIGARSPQTPSKEFG